MKLSEFDDVWQLVSRRRRAGELLKVLCDPEELPTIYVENHRSYTTEVPPDALDACADALEAKLRGDAAGIDQQLAALGIEIDEPLGPEDEDHDEDEDNGADAQWASEAPRKDAA